MTKQGYLLLVSIILMVIVFNVRLVNAEDDCGYPTWIVQPLDTGAVLCIGEGL